MERTAPILFVDHASALGGAERSLLLLLTHLNQEKLQPHLVCVDGPLQTEAKALKVPVYPTLMPRLRRSAASPVRWLKGAAAIARLSKHIHADLIYANTVRAAMYAAPAAYLSRRPFLWHMRDFWLSEDRPGWLWLDDWGKRMIIMAAARVITNSDAVAVTLPQGNKITVVHNGIDIGRFNRIEQDSQFRRRHHIPVGVPLVGTIGRLRPWKGQDRFLRVAATVAGQVSKSHFIVVGGTPFQVADDYGQKLRQLAVELGLQNRIVFTGQLDDVRPALAAMDIFVHAGEPEPFGLVNLEAMAMAKPVVAFGHGALPEIVIDGETGLLVPPMDEVAMAQAISSLLADLTRRRLLGARGRQRVENCFSYQRMANEVMTVIEEVLS